MKFTRNRVLVALAALLVVSLITSAAAVPGKRAGPISDEIQASAAQLPAQAAKKRSKRRCGVYGKSFATLAKNRFIRVYTRGPKPRESYWQSEVKARLGYPENRPEYVCAFRHPNRSFQLNRVNDPESYRISSPYHAIAGNFVAFFAYSGRVNSNSDDVFRIHVIDAQTGEQKQIDYQSLVDAGAPFSIQVTSKGSVAFTACTGVSVTDCAPAGTLLVPTDPANSPVLQRFVAVVDSRGARVLDQTPTLDYLSLRRKGSNLTWRDGGQIKTASIR